MNYLPNYPTLIPFCMNPSILPYQPSPYVSDNVIVIFIIGIIIGYGYGYGYGVGYGVGVGLVDV